MDRKGANDFPDHVHDLLRQLQKNPAATNEALVALESLVLQRGKRRGRPPVWMTGPSRRRRRDLPHPPNGHGAALALPRDWRTVKVWAVSARKPGVA